MSQETLQPNPAESAGLMPDQQQTISDPLVNVNTLHDQVPHTVEQILRVTRELGSVVVPMVEGKTIGTEQRHLRLPSSTGARVYDEGPDHRYAHLTSFKAGLSVEKPGYQRSLTKDTSVSIDVAQTSFKVNGLNHHLDATKHEANDTHHEDKSMTNRETRKEAAKILWAAHDKKHHDSGSN